MCFAAFFIYCSLLLSFRHWFPYRLFQTGAVLISCRQCTDFEWVWHTMPLQKSWAFRSGSDRDVNAEESEHTISYFWSESFSQKSCIRILVTYSEVSWNVGSSQDSSGSREEDGEDGKERFSSEVRTHVFPHDCSWWENNFKHQKDNSHIFSATVYG